MGGVIAQHALHDLDARRSPRDDRQRLDKGGVLDIGAEGGEAYFGCLQLHRRKTKEAAGIIGQADAAQGHGQGFKPLPKAKGTVEAHGGLEKRHRSPIAPRIEPTRHGDGKARPSKGDGGGEASGPGACDENV